MLIFYPKHSWRHLIVCQNKPVLFYVQAGNEEGDTQGEIMSLRATAT